MIWDRPKPQTRSAPSPLVGEGGEGGGAGSDAGARVSGPPSPTPPHRKSGLPDLRTQMPNPGEPGFGGEGSALAEQVAHHLATRARWSALEYAFWLAALASIFLLPSRHLILTEIAWLGLFALSLDLILGYAGIISLGHAAFFGLGSYAAALLAKHAIINEPLLALIAAGCAAAMLGFATSFLVLRGSDLTRLMVTLGIALIMREIANQIPELTGGADGLQGVTIAPILGTFQFDIFGHVGYVYCLVVLFVLFLLARRIVYSPFGLSLRAVKGNPLRSSSIGISVNARLVAVYTLAAFYAGVAGALLAQTTSFASLDVFSFERSADLLLVLIIGGTGYLYGGLIGAVAFKLIQDGLATFDPQYWQYWIGLLLVFLVLFGRIYGAIIAVIVFAISSWLRLSFFECALVMLVIGIGYDQIRNWLNLLDNQIAQLMRQARSARKALLQRKP
jgi:branched-chain amino acid transport system permease protein